MKQKLVEIIAKSSAVSICADFWTGKDGLGYLGIAASVIQKFERHDYLLALRHVTHPHTADKVSSSINNILVEFGINGLDDPKIISISTDNGSNMVAGLRNTVELNDEIAIEYSDDDDEIAIEYSDNDEPKDETPQIDFFGNLYSKRIPCTNHILNNNLKCSISLCETVNEILQSAKSLIKKLKHKGTVVDYFVEKKLPKLILPPKTRWQYFFDMTNSLLLLKEHMPHICSFAQVDNLTISQYDKIKSLNGIFKLYSNQIKRFELHSSKLSDAIPAMISLILELNDHTFENVELVNLLKSDLARRTQCMFSVNHSSFNAIFGLATYLDPGTRKYLSVILDGFNMEELKHHIEQKIRSIYSSKSLTPTTAKKSKPEFSKLDDLLGVGNISDEIKR